MFIALTVFYISLSPVFSQENLSPIIVSDFDSSLMGLIYSPVWQSSQLDLEQTPFVQDVLAKAPGVIMTQNGGVGSRGAIFLRGAESRHTLFMIDGLRLNDPSNTDRHFDTAFLFSNQYDSVQMLRGPSPVIYGGDATSGVVELTPRRGASANETLSRQISLTFGSFDTWLATGQSDWKAGRHQGTFGLMHLKTVGFSRFNRDRATSAEKDGAESTQFFQASKHQWTKNIKTDLYLQHSFSKVQQDGFDTSGNPIDADQDESRNRNLQFVQTTSIKQERGHSWIKTGVNKIKRDIYTLSQGEEFYRGDIQQIQLGQQIHSGLDTTSVGFNFDQENYADKALSASNDIWSTFIQQKVNLKKLNLFLGARGESHQRYGEFLAYEGALDYALRDELTSYIKYAQGYKSPSLYQLFGPNSFGSPVGNPSLDPELNRSMELGVEWSERYVVSFILFQQDFQNLIAFTNQGYANRGSMRIKGAEFSTMSPEHFWGQVQINFGVLDFSHYTQAPLRRPPSYGNIIWMLNREQWGFELGARYLGTRRDVDFKGNRVKLSAYELLNAKLRYQPNDSQDFILSLGNLTDRNYEDVWGYAVAPLNFSVTYNLRF